MTEDIGAVGMPYSIITGAVAAGGQITVRPAAGKIYMITSISSTAFTDLKVRLTDGALFSELQAVGTQLTHPIFISNTIYLNVYNSGGTAGVTLGANGVVLV